MLAGNRQCGIAKHRRCVHFGMKVSAATSCGSYRVVRHFPEPIAARIVACELRSALAQAIKAKTAEYISTR